MDITQSGYTKGSNNASYQPSAKDRKIIDLVESRFSSMRSARKPYEQEWRLAEDEFNAVIKPARERGLANINLPLELSLVDTKLADEMSAPIDFKFIVRDDELEYDRKGVEIYYKDIFEDSWLRDKTDAELYKVRSSKHIFGTGIGYECYEKVCHVCKYESIAEDGSIKHEKRENMLFDGVRHRYVDIRNFYPNEVETDIAEMTDCIMIETFDFDYYTETKKVQLGYRNISKIAPSSSNVYKPFDNAVSEDTSNGNRVYVIHYFNVVLDCHYEIANGVLVKSSPLPNHKMLPFCVMVSYPQPNRFWGRGIPEVIKYLKSVKRTARNMIIDGTKTSIFPAVTIAPNVDFDVDNSRLGPGSIWRVAPEAIQVLPIRAALADAYNLESKIDEDIVIATGVDNRALVSSPSETATKTAVKREIANKRTNLGLKHEAFNYFSRLGKIRLCNIQQNYSVPDKNGDYRSIIIKDADYEMEYNPTDGKLKKGLVRKDTKGSYGTGSIIPELMNSDVDVMVNVDTMIPVSRELNKSSLVEMLPQAQAMVGDDGKHAFNQDYLAKKLAEAYDFDPMDALAHETQGQGLDVDAELEKRGLPNPNKQAVPQEPQMQGVAPMQGQVPQMGQQEGVPGLQSMPKLPNMLNQMQP